VDAGLAHPAELSAAVLERLLPSIHERKRTLVSAGEREPVIAAENVPVLALAIVEGLRVATPSERVRFSVYNPDRFLLLIPSGHTTRGVAFLEPDGVFNLVFDVVNGDLDPDEEHWGDPTKRALRRADLDLPPEARLRTGESGRSREMWVTVPFSVVAAGAPLPAAPEKEAAPVAEERATPPPAAVPPEELPGGELGAEEILERLRYLEELYDDGAISESEYVRRKRELLDLGTGSGGD
jgi:hypothetical protein